MTRSLVLICILACLLILAHSLAIAIMDLPFWDALMDLSEVGE